ncbi:MAG: hypothetical protein LBV16_05125, partial [Elusimicrobiota bacterium]|nr:hypothetical protein [Elusimicrobiota bacterium]
MGNKMKIDFTNLPDKIPYKSNEDNRNPSGYRRISSNRAPDDDISQDNIETNPNTGYKKLAQIAGQARNDDKAVKKNPPIDFSSLPDKSPLVPTAQDESQTIQNNFKAAIDITPERVKNVETLAKQFSVLPAFADANYDGLVKAQSVPTIQKLVDLSNYAPTTFEFLKNPVNAAIVKDDVDNIAAFEKSLTNLKQDFDFEGYNLNKLKKNLEDAMQTAQDNVWDSGSSVKNSVMRTYYQYQLSKAIGQARAKLKDNPNAVDAFSKNDAVNKYRDILNQIPDAQGVSMLPAATMEFITQQIFAVPSIVGTAKYMIPTMAAGGAAYGSIVPGLGTAAGFGLGAAAGIKASLLGGMVKHASDMEGNFAFNEYAQMRDEKGAPYSIKSIETAASAVGAVNGLLEFGGDIIGAKLLAPLGKAGIKLVGQGAPKALSKAAQTLFRDNPAAKKLIDEIQNNASKYESLTLRQALISAGKNLFLATAGEVGEEFAQGVMTETGAQAISGNWNLGQTFGNATDGLGYIALGAIGTFGLGSFAPNMFNRMSQDRLYKQVQTQQALKQYDDIGELYNQVKLSERDPQKAQTITKEVLEKAQADSILIEMEPLMKFAQEQGITRAQIQEKFGISNEAWTAAMESDKIIEIPISKWLQAKKVEFIHKDGKKTTGYEPEAGFGAVDFKTGKPIDSDTLKPIGEQSEPQNQTIKSTLYDLMRPYIKLYGEGYTQHEWEQLTQKEDKSFNETVAKAQEINADAQEKSDFFRDYYTQEFENNERPANFTPSEWERLKSYYTEVLPAYHVIDMQRRGITDTAQYIQQVPLVEVAIKLNSEQTAIASQADEIIGALEADFDDIQNQQQEKEINIIDIIIKAGGINPNISDIDLRGELAAYSFKESGVKGILNKNGKSLFSMANLVNQMLIDSQQIPLNIEDLGRQTEGSDLIAAMDGALRGFRKKQKRTKRKEFIDWYNLAPAQFKAAYKNRFGEKIPAKTFGQIHKKVLEGAIIKGAFINENLIAQYKIKPKYLKERQRYEQMKERQNAQNTQNPDKMQKLNTENVIESENFKKWFGDWKIARKMNQVLNREAQEYAPHNSLNKKEIEKTFRNIGEIKNADIGNVLLPINTAGKIISHKGFDISTIVKFFPEMFSDAILIESLDNNNNHKQHNNIKSWHNLLNQFKIGNDTYFIRFTVKENKVGRNSGNEQGDKLLHSSFVSDVAIYKKAGGESNLSGIINPARTLPPTDAILQQYIDAVNNSSKVVDENGKPLVVYHGSNQTFNIFENKGLSNSAPSKIGYWFDNKKEVAQ